VLNKNCRETQNFWILIGGNVRKGERKRLNEKEMKKNDQKK
jgi:hypothetical protein